MTTRAWAARSADRPLAPFSLTRRDLGPTDVALDILYCGVCHSDLHQVRDEWKNTVYPCVPGHEIVGRVTAVGAEVTRFAAGDHAAVGCMVDSCRDCASCERGEEQYCEKTPVLTYNGEDRHLGGTTFGGYSERVVVDEAFALRLAAPSDPKELAAVAPLVCAGITTWAPLKRHGVGPGTKVGVVGLGGLGHMAVKFASALGAHVVVLTTSPGKADAARALGAHEVVVSTDPAAMEERAGTLDFVLDTVSARHDVNAGLNLLRLDGTYCLVGAPEDPLPVEAFQLINPRRRFVGSLIGGVAETQEMLDFCAERGITADVEVIPIQEIEAAYARMLTGDVRYRFVIDLASLKEDAPA
ncbi:MAG: NAD(P)-dependent alcohol dehydrogenase [Planctomycetota bacterium JB042]